MTGRKTFRTKLLKESLSSRWSNQEDKISWQLVILPGAWPLLKSLVTKLQPHTWNITYLNCREDIQIRLITAPMRNLTSCEIKPWARSCSSLNFLFRLDFKAAEVVYGCNDQSCLQNYNHTPPLKFWPFNTHMY